MAISIDLSGKTAIVTGAGRGLGKAIAISLASAGAKVALAARTKEQLEGTAHQIEKAGGHAIAVPTDVTSEEDVALLIKLALNELGGIHILVNNAGIERAAPLLETTVEDWDRVMKVNLRGMFLPTRAAGPTLIDQKWGRVLNMSSVGGTTIAAPNNSPYHASKAGAILFTKSLAMEWARYNITVNALAPGWFQTEMLDSIMKGDEAKKERYRKAIPARRFGQPEELGPLAAYLCSDLSSYITGQAFIVDGGMSSM